MALTGAERAQLRQQLAAVAGPLKLEYYHQSPRRVIVAGRAERPTCKIAKELYEELAELSDQIALTIYEYEDSKEQVRKRNIVEVPCLLIRGELNRPVRFYGAPTGHLLVALVRVLVLASTRQAQPSVPLKRLLGKLRRRSTLRVLGSAHDPNSGQAALAACAAALLSPKLQTDVFAIDEFPEIGARSGIGAVPSLFVDDRFAAAGMVEPLELISFIGLSQIKPEQAQLNPPPTVPNTATGWRPPPTPQQREAAAPDPIAQAAGRAREASTPEGMRRTAGGLIVPNR